MITEEDQTMIVTRHPALVEFYRRRGVTGLHKQYVRPIEVTGKVIFGELPFYMIPNCKAFYHTQFDFNPALMDSISVEDLEKYKKTTKRYTAEAEVVELKPTNQEGIESRQRND